ncbi:MAG TPA: uroporphyrinogen decarboxylase family protein [Rectinemataceae bacterium]|nr:uroporphyrinogen decarboxylase family protein [Rectinemataceae bacterium]
MEKIERAKKALQGEAVDRVPYSIWTHFPIVDLDAAGLAKSTMAFYREYDLDFVKSMPNGMFSIEDYDCGCDFSEVPKGGVAKTTKLAVTKPSDWARLSDLDVEKGALGRELRSLKLILDELHGEAPVIATVFSPLTTALKLSGPNLMAHIRTDPEKVKAGLEILTATTVRFAERATEMGCAGIFLASQMAQRGRMNEAEYREFGVPYDLKVFEAVKANSWFNIMHIHGDEILFDLLKDYPAQGISWHVWETAPTIGEFVAADTGKCLVGGLRRFKITEGELPEIAKDISETIRQTGGRRLFLAPGCEIRAPYNAAAFEFIKRAIAETASK